jgi:glycosyltransferase involved in cell wall biosynthesis
MAGIAPDDGYPRALILGGGFDSYTGTGVTLSNLFRGWPRAKLAVVDYMHRPETAYFADMQYCRGAAEERWVWPLSAVAARSQQAETRSGASLVDDASVQTASPRGLRSAREGLRRLGADAVLQRSVLSEPLKRFVGAFAPEVLYCHFSTLDTMHLVTAVHTFCGARLAVHMMDDWPATVYGDTLLGPALRLLVDHELRALFARASTHMAISDAMASEYSARYGYGFEVFHNCIDVSWWREHRKTTWEISLPLRLVYSGRIGWDAIESFEEVCEAVELLARGGLSAEFRIHTQDVGGPEAAALASYPHTTVLPAVENASLPAVLADADVLVIPSGFTGLSRRFSRLSMPTKVPAYMASGTPIVIYAPGSHGICVSAKRGGWGLVVGERSPMRLASTLVELAGCLSMREALGHTATGIADSAFDGRRVRSAFLTSLTGLNKPDR